jgi:glycosyltransferase involved in cell wall biosynthesis
MSGKPVISVVIPTYNRAEALELTLQHLARQTLPHEQFEVIVVDDGSNDHTEQVVAKRSWPFPLTYLKQMNRGAAATRNLGVAQARADLILFLDADVIPEPQLLAAHIQSHTEAPHHLVVGRVKPWPKNSKSWYEQVVDPESVGMDYGDQPRILPFYMALGGNFSINRQAFAEIGGYDENFPAAGAEETEFAYRAEMRNYSLRYQPVAVGYHNHPRTLMQRLHQQAAHMRSMALLITKHPLLQTVIFGVDELMPILSPPRSVKAMWRRCRAFVLGSAPARTILYRVLIYLDHHRLCPRLTSIVFWRLLTGWRWIGFREGLRRYGRTGEGRSRKP